MATIASGTAAVVISQFSVRGTWIAAAVTPVLVTLISELLQRPTQVIASRMTTDRPAVVKEKAPPDPMTGDEPPVRVYRSGGARGPRTPRVRKKVAISAIAVTALLAFAITAVAMTGTELITGGSIGKGSSRTTLLGGKKRDSTTNQDNQTTTPTNTNQNNQQQRDQQQQTTPQNQDQQQQPAPQQQTAPQPTTPSTTTPAAPPTSTTP